MKKIIYTLTITSVVLGLSGCNKWFEVTPISEVRSEQHFKTIKGFQQSLTGCYIALSDQSLYGRELSWYFPEVLAHQYRESVSETEKAIFDHKYEDKNVFRRTEDIWNRLYNVIVNANDAIAKIDEKKETLSLMEYSIIKGELLAVRAYLHFDLLRYYGFGGYATRHAELAEKPSIPYVTVLKKDATKQFTGEELYTALMQDLDESLRLLREYDPIISEAHEEELKKINIESYYSNRQFHLNYYAVRALQARVALWFGTPDAIDTAIKAAKEVVDASKNNSLIKKNISTEIRLQKQTEVSAKNCSFAGEALFCLDVPKLDSYTSQYFKINPADADRLVLVHTQEYIQEIFNGSNTDLRVTKVLHRNTGGTYSCLKYFSPDQKNNRVNMIRLPEVYLILAEAYTQKQKNAEAIDLLKEIRKLRGFSDNLEDSADADKIKKEVLDEYKREFLCEGVMFFQLKRLREKNIPAMGETKEMGDEQYLLLFPDLENSYGRKQK